MRTLIHSKLMRHPLGKLHWAIFLSLALVANAEDKSRPNKQFMIEARLIKIKADLLQGHSLDWRRGYLKKESLFKDLSVVLTTPQVSMVLRKLADDEDAEFHSNFRIIAGVRQAANFKLTQKPQPVQISISGQDISPVFGDYEDPNFANAISVIPSIGTSGEITLQIQPVLERKQSAQAFKPPVPFPTEFQSVLESGETVAMFDIFEEPDQEYSMLIFITPSLLKP